MHHVDVLRPDLRVRNEAILSGDEVHEWRAGTDHSSRSPHPKIGHDAVLRRPDFSAGQLVDGSLDAFRQLDEQVLRLVKRLRDLVIAIAAKLDDAGPRFGDDLVGTGDLGGRFAPSPLDLRRFPFQGEKARPSFEPVLGAALRRRVPHG
jgi:hypothetical protein